MLTTEIEPYETSLHGSLGEKAQILKIKCIKYHSVTEISRCPCNARLASSLVIEP